MRKVTYIMSLVTLSMLGIAVGTAWAQSAPGADLGDAVGSLFGQIVDMLKNGHYWAAGAVALVAALTWLRFYGSKLIPWLGTDAGGSALLILLAFAGSLASSLGTGSVMSLALLWTAGKVAWVVAAGLGGSYVLVRKLLVWLLAKLPGKFAWIGKILDYALHFVMGSKATIAAAKAAGEQAVKDNPATGAGESTDLN